MEALVSVFAEIIIACLEPVLAIIGALVGAVIEGIFTPSRPAGDRA